MTMVRLRFNISTSAGRSSHKAFPRILCSPGQKDYTPVFAGLSPLVCL